jgi:hypothetical protein
MAARNEPTGVAAALAALEPHCKSARCASALKTLRSSLLGEDAGPKKSSRPFSGAKEKAAGYFAGGGAKG